MRTTLKQLAEWVPGSRLTADAAFDGVSADSRRMKAGNLFIALNGQNFNAHRFLPDVAKAGAAAVVAETVPENYPVPVLLVEDTHQALGLLAKNWRRRFAVPVAGIAGSNGKTTVKEMVSSVFRVAYGENFLGTQGNLNNDIGVPLTLFRMNESHRAAVVELGMNHPGEMAYLTAIAQPTIGLVNNAQREHQEFMQSVEASAKENGTVIKQLPADGIAVFPADDVYAPIWADYAGSRKKITFGFLPEADVHTEGMPEPGRNGTKAALSIAGGTFDVHLATNGLHNVRNAMAAAAASLAAGIDAPTIVRGLESFAPYSGRLERKAAFNGALLIDDTYNANPDSVKAAIDVLSGLSGDSIFVLGDMGEVGSQGPRFHAEAGEYAREKQISGFYTFGSMAEHASRAYGKGAKHFTDLNEINAFLRKRLTPQAAVLVKGSRFMKMERIVEQLISAAGKEGR